MTIRRALRIIYQNIFVNRIYKMLKRKNYELPMINKPLVLILGATGCGKTKLSIDICKRFNGEVISTDSMQIYEGLDIATNKVTQEEADGIPHHMISYLNPFTFGYTVVPFRNRAVKIINDLYSKGKLPVIVGGTNYYNEAILWKILLSEPDDDSSHPVSYFDLLDHFPAEYANLSNEQLHEELKKIDPAEAEVVHPSKRRRVVRCIQYFHKEGRRISDDLRLQRELKGASELGGPLRFPNSCVIWLQCDKDVLRQRLDARVDEMVTRGLREEVTSYYDRYHADYRKALADFNVAVNEGWTKGVFQCIGIKEFSDYLRLSPDERATDAGCRAFDACVELLKISTRQYANQQTRWIRNRFLRAGREAPPVYALNATDVRTWTLDVAVPALRLVDEFLAGCQTTSLAPLPSVASTRHDRVIRMCDICNIKTESGQQYEIHCKSKRHKANVCKKKWEAQEGDKKRNKKIISDNAEKKTDVIDYAELPNDYVNGAVGESDIDAIECNDNKMSRRIAAVKE